MQPDPKRKDLQWFYALNTYEVAQGYVFNISHRSISLAKILKNTRKWMQKVGLIKKRPFYAM